MKKFLAIMLAALLLLAAGCTQKEKTAAEIYLENHTEQEILNYFEKVIYTYESFNNPKELSSKALLDFITVVPTALNLEQWYDETSVSYLVPMQEIYNVFDQYFTEYNFGPENCFYGHYDAEKDILSISAVGGGTGCTALAFISAEAIDADNIKVMLNMYCSDQEPNLNEANVYITARIIDGEAQFTSYIRTDYTPDEQTAAELYLENHTARKVITAYDMPDANDK